MSSFGSRPSLLVSLIFVFLCRHRFSELLKKCIMNGHFTTLSQIARPAALPPVKCCVNTFCLNYVYIHSAMVSSSKASFGCCELICIMGV